MNIFPHYDIVVSDPSHSIVSFDTFNCSFLTDRTNGRAYATVLRLSVCLSVIGNVTICIAAKRCALEQKSIDSHRKSYVRNRLVPK